MASPYTLRLPAVPPYRTFRRSPNRFWYYLLPRIEPVPALRGRIWICANKFQTANLNVTNPIRPQRFQLTFYATDCAVISLAASHI